MVIRKMKEKCKDAARMRREKERAEFVELSKLLPLPATTTSQLDKASIIRLTSSYLRMRTAFPEGLGKRWGTENSAAYSKFHHPYRGGEMQHQHIQHHHQQRQLLNSSIYNQQQSLLHQPTEQIKELGSLLLQTLDGFVFALHKDGKIMYISETASVHLGLPQIDLTGSSIFEYVHPSDHNDIYEILGLTDADMEKLTINNSETCELGRSFCMRMKCILPKRNAGLVNSGYKAIHCNGYLKVRCKQVSSVSDNNKPDESVSSQVSTSSSHIDCWESYALVAVGHSLLPTASTEIKLTGNSFMFRANLDLTLYYIEAPVLKLLEFEQIDMISKSLYQFIHVDDVLTLESSHRSLLEKGQVVSKYYRLMKKGGGFIWIQSYATLVNNPRSMPKPQHIVSICFILGENDFDQSCLLHDEEASVCENKVKTTHQEGGGFVYKLNNNNNPKREERHHTVKRARKNSKTSITPTTNPMNIFQKSNNTEYQHNRCQCSCSSICNISDNNNVTTIGSSRRPSDDSCSIVSSAASTSQMSSSSSMQNSDYLCYLNNESYIINPDNQTARIQQPYMSVSLTSKQTVVSHEHISSSVIYENSVENQSHKTVDNVQRIQPMDISDQCWQIQANSVCDLQTFQSNAEPQILLDDSGQFSTQPTNICNSTGRYFETSSDWCNQTGCSNMNLDQYSRSNTDYPMTSLSTQRPIDNGYMM